MQTLRNSRVHLLLPIALMLGVSCNGDHIQAPSTPSLTALPHIRRAVVLDQCPAGATRWLTAVNGGWLDAARWSAGAPTATTPACIDLPGTYVVTVNVVGSTTTNSVFIGSPGSATQPILRNVRGALVVQGDIWAHGRVELSPGPGNTASFDASGTIAVAPTGTLATVGIVGGTFEAGAIENDGSISVAVFTAFRTSRFLNAGTVSILGSSGARVSAEASPTEGSPPDVDFVSGSVAASRYDQWEGTLDVTGGMVTGTFNLFAPAQLHLGADNGGLFNLAAAIGNVPPAISQISGIVGASQQVSIGGNHVTVETPGLVNRGAITVNSVSALGRTGTVFRTQPGATLTNEATVTMTGNGGPWLVGSIENAATGLITQNNAAVIRAAPLVNRGTIRVPTGHSLLVRGLTDADPAVVQLEEGLVEATGNITLFSGQLTVNGGTVAGIVRVDPPGQVVFNGNTGGQFNVLGGGVNEGPLATQLSGTIGATEHLLVGTSNIVAEVSSSLVNNGRITISSAPGLGLTGPILRTIDGGAITNTASGTIHLQGILAPTLAGSVVNEGLVTNGNNAGLHGNPFVNRGIVRVAQGLSMNANPPAAEPPPIFVNDGGTLELTGSYNQTRGRFEHLNGTVAGAGASTFNGVRFSGFGTWARALTLTGASALAPGASPGRIAIGGDYTPSATTVTEIELGDGAPGVGYDQIAVAGTARFAGTLSVLLADDFVPRPCQTFDVVTYAARTAAFTNAATPIDVGGGMKLRQVYTATGLVLVAYSADGPNVNPTQAEVSVDGVTDTYDVCIGAGADVITVLPEDQVLVDKQTLTFGASQLPQTVTVSASPAANRSTALIRHTASSGTPVATVTVSISGFIPPDTDPPMTIAVASPGPNAQGWNRTDVSVALSATDGGGAGPSSGAHDIVWSLAGSQTGGATVLGSSASVSVTAEGVTTLTYFARDAAGNQESPRMLVVRIDKTAPGFTVARDVPPNANGWNNTSVIGTFAGSDGLSGLAGEASISMTFSAEGANQSATHVFMDRADNTSVATISGISIDKTAPSFTAARDVAPNANGWNNTNVIATFAASDALSGIDGLANVNVTLGNEGANQLAAHTFRDRAGNAAVATIGGISIDKTAPAVTVTRQPPPGPDGFNNTDVTATFTATDALSLVDGAAVIQVVFSQNGANQSATRSFTDRAGNSASATISGISINKTPPKPPKPLSISCSATPSAIWPPNDKLIPVSITVKLKGGAPGSSFVLERVWSNEPGWFDIVDFQVGTADTQGKVRAERWGFGHGRVYTFKYRGTDSAGDEATAKCEVRVSHDKGHDKHHDRDDDRDRDKDKDRDDKGKGHDKDRDKGRDKDKGHGD